jgi:hypothetical protein
VVISKITLLHINTLATTIVHRISPSYLMHCTILLSTHSCAFTLDNAEPELEVQAEQAQVEDPTNLVWIKASPDASNNHP